MATERRFQSLKEFFPYYLQEHSARGCRVLHYIGSTLVLAVIGLSVYLQNYWLLFLMPVAGYGFAWVGHFFIEKNKPATFKYPLYSLISDWIMYFRFLTGTLKRPLIEAGVLDARGAPRTASTAS
ncbi:MAG: DUF962 domain-containing protein [Leptospiraceae bacterium]|nr:DUF962 domain-containing protein [Leptospiraceae bacterium]